MKETPIIFSAPMVKAILEGRKSQTRRSVYSDLCPWGVPGDRMWVPESFQKCGCDACRFAWPKKGPHGIAAFREGYRGPSCAAFTPSIFMPRWASRITLEITDVRLQLMSHWVWALTFRRIA
jgi:hypothetical protein